jgi:uncharacterized membrane protein YphA (DoxX/SURF4 family)
MSSGLRMAAMTALRLVLGGVLLWAGLAKVSEPGLFAQTVRAYEVLPLFAAHPFAVVVPWIEVVVSGCLLAGLWVRSSALLASGLLVSFGVAIVVNLVRGADISCGCFALDGTGGSLTGALVRDLALLAVSVPLVITRETLPLSVDRVLAQRRRSGPDDS